MSISNIESPYTVNYTKKELLRHLADATGIDEAECTAVFDAFVSVISTLPINGGSIKVNGFGRFVAVKEAKKIGRNPLTGQVINIPERASVRFRPSKSLRTEIG